MSERAIKKTYIKFGLTVIPVSITTLQEKDTIKFNNLCPTCKSPIKEKRYCVNCNKELNNYRELLKGFRISKNNYIVLTQEQIENLKKIEDTGIEVKAFIPEDTIKFYYIDRIYNLIPTDYNKMILKPFILFREVLKLSGLCAIGKIVMRSKEYICLIKHFENRLFLITLLHPHKISLPTIVEEAVDETELNQALELIEKMKTTFDELHYKGFTKDEYLQKFSDLIKGKIPTSVSNQVKEFKKMVEEMKKKVKKNEKEDIG